MDVTATKVKKSPAAAGIARGGAPGGARAKVNAPAPQEPGTRDRLVLAALNLFWEKGYAATGLKEILELSGANAGSQYHFFPTKDGLLMAVLEKHEEILCERVLGEMARVGDVREKLASLFAFYRGFLLRTECALGCPMVNLAGEIGDSHPEARAKLAGMMGMLREGVREALGVRTGGDDLSRVIVGSLQGALVQCRLERSVAPLDACERVVMGLV